MLQTVNPTHRIEREFVYQFLDDKQEIKNEVIFKEVCNGVLEVQRDVVILHAAATFSRPTDFTFYAYELILFKKILSYDEAEISVKWLDSKYKPCRDVVFKKGLRYKPAFKDLDLGFVDTHYYTKEMAVEFRDNSIIATVEFDSYIPVIHPNAHAEQELFYTGFYNISATAIDYNNGVRYL